jgi:hypothetical protein
MDQAIKSVPNIVCLSSIFSTDRILIHSKFIENLSEFARPVIWSRAVFEDSFPKGQEYSKYFEPISATDSIPYWLTLLRHFGDYVRDHKGLSASRQSHWRLRQAQVSAHIEKFLRSAAKVFATLHADHWVEQGLEAAVLRYGQSLSALSRFKEEKPAGVIAMGPFKPAQMSIVAAAKQLSIPVIAYITSWDNITTKTGLVFRYDGYIVWSEQMKRELLEFYPASRSKPIYVIGAPQYDVFAQEQYFQTRDDFFLSNHLDPERKLVVYCLGSPNIVREDYGALQFVERIHASEDLSAVQVIVRPHPGFFENGYTQLDEIRSRYPGVLIQSPHRHWQRAAFQGRESIIEWVNTLRYADVVINFASTISVDAAVCDKPVVNLDFDPQPGMPNRELVREINHRWNHFRPVAESGGVWMAEDMEAVMTAVKTYLDRPELHRQQRQWIVKYVCEKVDGLASKRMAEAVADIMCEKVCKV